MSELRGEARIIIRPDTTRFRAELQASLLAATRGVVVPIPVTAAVAPAGLATAAAQSQAVTAALTSQIAATQVLGAQSVKAAQQSRALITSQEQLRRGAAATALSLGGVRGATLAASGSFLAGAAAVALFAKSVALAAGLEEELNVFRVTAGATAQEMERVRETAVALGRDLTLPAVSAGDAAQAITLLARAGLSVEDSLAGARGVLQLATAAQIDNAAATELAASALNAFGLAGEEAVRVADLLANSANLSQGEITDMGIALRQSAGAAAQVGLSLEDTVTVLTALARTGLAGSDAGTTLRVALLRLVAPTKDAQKALERFNINLRDTQGNLRVEAFFELEAALRAVSRAEADRARVAIFGQNAFRISALLGRESVASFNELEEAVEQQGAAAELAGARTAGFSGRVEALKSNLETLGTTLGTAVLPGLTLVVEGLNELVETASLATDAVGLLSGELNETTDAFFDFIPAGDRVSEVLKTIAKDTLGPAAGFTFTARQIQRVSGVFRESSDEIRGDARRTEEDVRKLFASFQAQGGISSATALNEFVLALDEMADRLAKGDTQAQKLARRIRELIKELQNPASFIVDLDLNFDQSDIDTRAGETGKDAADRLVENFERAGGALSEVGPRLIRDFLSATQPAAEKAGSDTGDAFVKGFNEAQIRGQLQAQKTAVAQAQAFGETGLEELIKEREKIDRILSSAKRPSGPVLEALFLERSSIINQIESILEQQARESERVKDEAERARKERDRNILDAIGLRESARVNAVIKAQATESLQDDLEAQIALRNFFRRSIQEIRKTVQDAQTRAQAIAAATRQLIQAQQEVRETQEALKEQLRQERREERERQRESLALDVQIAQATGNRRREIQAREAEIDFIQEQIRQTRKGSNQRKRLILELRQAQKELRELRGEREKTAQAFRELTFSFLQTQQGFAANLLGNLIPGGATAGLVGGVSPTTGLAAPQITPGAQAQQDAAVAAGRDLGFSRGQGNETNAILRSILNALLALNGRAGHPEARYQRATQSAFMDVIGT